VILNILPGVRAALLDSLYKQWVASHNTGCSFINFYEVNRGMVRPLHVPHECRKSTDQGSSSSTWLGRLVANPFDVIENKRSLTTLLASIASNTNTSNVDGPLPLPYPTYTEGFRGPSSVRYLTTDEKNWQLPKCFGNWNLYILSRVLVTIDGVRTGEIIHKTHITASNYNTL
jgi:hypothetical protein